MTTTRSTAAAHVASEPAQPFRLPDIPEKHPDDMTSYDELHQYGAAANIIHYLGESRNHHRQRRTLHRAVDRLTWPGKAATRTCWWRLTWTRRPMRPATATSYRSRARRRTSVLEVASRHTASDDLEWKKDYYERIGVSEYWLFDSKAEFYRFTLRGYQLVGGRYEEIPTPETAPGVFQGYSAALGLNLRAEAGYLGWHDPATGEHIPTLVSERVRAETEAARAEIAEARVQELEAENRRLREGR